MAIKARRYHDISCGHRVVGHEGKCRHLHGHNYRIHFVCQAEIGVEATDAVGRVIDFGEIKSLLCMWLEDNWDHKFLAWEKDSVIRNTIFSNMLPDNNLIRESFVFVPFNPTAENMAEYLLKVVGPAQLTGTYIELVEVLIEETAKCSAIANWSQR